ncbi:MAG: hypothetical protein H6Q89_3704 [Myxococcaceae bacterium]|nr:hypothetical protein [Myxococcaceae bacterium]
MRLWGGALLLGLLCCAPRGPTALTPAQLQSRASRTFPAAFDEVFDATWLTLEAAGWKVTANDRRAGTVSTDVVAAPNGTGRAWTAGVTQEGATVAVTLLPRVYEGEREVTEQMYWTLEGKGGELERWERLFAGITGLIDAWRVHPELLLSKTRGELDAVGLRLLVPGWPHFQFSVDRRTLVMQGVGAGLLPTLLYRIERRRPDPDLSRVVRETLEHAFHAAGRVVEPEWEIHRDGWGEAAEGAVLLEADLTPKPVRWRRWEAGNPAWVVRVVAVCAPGGEGGLDCDGEVRRVIESAVNTAPLPGIRAR